MDVEPTDHRGLMADGQGAHAQSPACAPVLVAEKSRGNDTSVATAIPPPDVAFRMPHSTKRNHGVLEKLLIPSLRKGKHKMNQPEVS